jgi:hypothetical protein
MVPVFTPAAHLTRQPDTLSLSLGLQPSERATIHNTLALAVFSKGRDANAASPNIALSPRTIPDAGKASTKLKPVSKAASPGYAFTVAALAR